MKNSIKIKFIVATLLLVVFIIDMIWWFRVTDRNVTFENTKSDYLSAFPNFLQNPILLTFIAIIFLVAAGVLFIQSRKGSKLKIASTIGLSLSFTLAFWQLFSLM